MRRIYPIVALVSLALLALLPSGSRTASAAAVEVSHWTLANGLRLVVIPDRRAPVVTHMVWYRVGSADEPQGKAGIAHFLEHLMFKGTEKVPGGEFSKMVMRNGGEDNAFTSKDFTAYYQRIASDRLELVMQLEADRMVNLTLTDEDVIPERAVVLEERRTRTDNDPSSLLDEQVDAALYLAHPYRKPVIGWMAEVSKLTREDAIDFYRRHYTPKNALVVVAGDVEPSAVKALAERIYGVVPAVFEPAPRLRTPEPEPIARRRVVLEDGRASSPTLSRSYLAPSYMTAMRGEAEALDVLAEILGGSTTSRLYRDLVVDRKLAAYAGAWFSGDGADSGTFGIYAAPVPGGDIAAVEAALDEVVLRLVTDGIGDEELARAKKGLVANTIYDLDSQFKLAYTYGVALTSGLDVEAVRGWPDRIAAVTGEDVEAAARKVLELHRSVTGILLPGGNGQSTAQN